MVENPLHSGPIKSELLDGTLNGYQNACQSTAIYPGQGTPVGLIYTLLKGAGETGEQLEKFGKILRDDIPQKREDLIDFLFSSNNESIPEEKRQMLALELGDELWYVAARAKELGYTLYQIASMNIMKLQDRQKRGKLGGSGDKR